MKMARKVVSALPILALSAALAGCSGGSSQSSSQSPGNTVNISGTLSGYTLASNESGLKRFLAMFSLGKAYATGSTVDNVVAVSPDGTFVAAAKSGNGFSLSLHKNRDYIVAFLNGTTIVGIYKADSVTGLNSFPIGQNSTDLDLGMVSINTGTGTGTVASSTVLQDLGLSQDIAKTFGVWDVGMLRYSNMDADGNGIIDYQENKSFGIGLDYEFNTGSTFAGIQGSFNDKALASYTGYEYYFWAAPYDASLPWTSATLTAPASVSDGTNSTPVTQCYNITGSNSMSLNFFCGGTAVSPVTPPTGTYTVNVGSQTYTFNNVQSQTIDAVNLYNIYVPSVKLTMSSGKIASIDYQWWKKDAVLGWVQPTDAELSTVLENAQFEIGQAGWAGDPNLDRVSGSVPFTASGTITPAAQGFTPGVFRISYKDRSQYNYGYEWR